MKSLARNKKTVEDMINEDFGGDRQAASQSCGITVAFLNNMVNLKRNVLKLHDGSWVQETSTTKIFKVSQGEPDE